VCCGGIFGEWRMLCDNAKSVQPPLLTPPKVVERIQIGLIIYGCGAAAHSDFRQRIHPLFLL